MNYKIETVDLRQERQSLCRVQICQFNSSDFDWQSHNGLSNLLYNEKIVSKVTLQLNVAKQSAVDLIIFPELSIPAKLISKIQEWSRQHGAIVVAGTHYHERDNEIISRSPIIVNGDVYFTEKISPSPLEISPIQGEGLSGGSIIRKFINTSFGTIGLLICSDYLDESVKSGINLDDIDILCVPAFQKQSSLYEQRMNIDCQNSKKGIYMLYSNFYDKQYGDGNSSIFGVMDKIFSVKFKEKNLTNLEPENKLIQLNNYDTYLIADLNLENKRPFVNRNISTTPNVSFKSKSSWSSPKNIDFLAKIANDDERYQRIDEYFVAPTEFPEILSLLEQQNLVFIIGDPGIGKTYTAVKLLKNYYEKGFVPMWFVGLEKEEREIQVKQLANFIPTANQIVYFEDPFGKTVFERKDILFQIFTPLLEKLSEYNSKVIITSRKEIFEKFQSESLLEQDILVLKKELNVSNPSYSNEQLTEIFDKLSSAHCEWHSNPEFVGLVHKAIYSKKLSTPLSIRDLVFASRENKTIEELQTKIQKREMAIVKTFALDILGTPPSSKLLLYLIFLDGHQGHNILSEIFKSTITTLKEQLSGITARSFNIELRSQIGYRIEQLGNVKTVYRFSHPVYEEALEMLALSDNTSEVILKAALLEFAKVNVKQAFQIINSFVLKYPDLSLILFKHLFENKHNIDDNILRISLTQRLISTYFRTKNKKFFDLAKIFFPLKELVDNINNSTDAIGLSQKLNLIQRYVNNSPDNFDSSYFRQIDFRKIFSIQVTRSSSPDQVYHILGKALNLNPHSLAIFLENFTSNTIKRIYLILHPSEREKFIELFPEGQIKRDLQIIQEKATHDVGNDLDLRTVKQFKSILFSDYLYDGEVNIDHGAEAALKKSWVSLLPAGITEVQGDFEIGQVVAVRNRKNDIIAIGLCEYSSSELRRIMGHSSNHFFEILGHYKGAPAIRHELLIKLFKQKEKSKKWIKRSE